MDDETTEERDTAERDDLTPDEAHRAGEFDDLRDMLTSITDKLNDALERIGAIDERIAGIYDKFADSVSQMVENGATVSEDDAAEARRGGVVVVDDGLLGALERLEGAGDQVLAGLGQHLDGHVIGNVPAFDQLADEVEVGLRG